jgi:hypothetical protein
MALKPSAVKLHWGVMDSRYGYWMLGYRWEYRYEDLCINFTTPRGFWIRKLGLRELWSSLRSGLRNLRYFHNWRGAGDIQRWKMIVCPTHACCSCYVHDRRIVHFVHRTSNP